MIVNVTAATGQLGRKAVQSLLGKSVDVVATVRNPEKARSVLGSGATIRHGDYNAPDTLVKAFADSEVLLLIPSIDPVERRIGQHFNTLQAAKEAGVKRVVFAGFMAATPESRFDIAPFLLYAESKLRLSGLDWTILRDGMYLDPIADWLPELIRIGRLPYPVKNGRVAYICRDDLARSLAAACMDDRHSQRLYKLSGGNAVSMPELAQIISTVVGKTITFDSVSDEEFVKICKADDEPEEIITTLLSMYQAVENGEFEEVTDDVESLTGTPPEPIEIFLRRSFRTVDSV
ncbi:MAG: SDR family oxidoreductase [Fuerstiella sp.]